MAMLFGALCLPATASAYDWLNPYAPPPTHKFPGGLQQLPIRASGTMAPLGAVKDQENDVYALWLNAGQRLDVSIRGTSGDGTARLFLYLASDVTTDSPGESMWTFAADTPLPGTRVASMTCDITQEGIYYLCASNDLSTTPMDYVLAASLYDPNAADVSSALPKPAAFTWTGFLDAVTAPDIPAADPDDVFAVQLTAGQPFIARLSGQSGSDCLLLLFKPGTASVKGDWGPTLASVSHTPGTSTERIEYTPTESGTYYLNVRAMNGTAGRYFLETGAAAPATGPNATSISIATDRTSVIAPRPFVLSGVLSGGDVGNLVVAWVKKPGKAYWSYSSNRLCYAAVSGGAKWWYRYTPIGRTSPKGLYYFKASFPGTAGKASCISPNVVSVRVR